MYKWIKGLEEIANLRANVIHECKYWPGKDWMTGLNHILREGNQSADKMAKIDIGLSGSNFTRWRNQPEGIESLIMQDALGVKLQR